MTHLAGLCTCNLTSWRWPNKDIWPPFGNGEFWSGRSIVDINIFSMTPLDIKRSAQSTSTTQQPKLQLLSTTHIRNYAYHPRRCLYNHPAEWQRCNHHYCQCPARSQYSSHRSSNQAWHRVQGKDTFGLEQPPSLNHILFYISGSSRMSATGTLPFRTLLPIASLDMWESLKWTNAVNRPRIP